MVCRLLQVPRHLSCCTQSMWNVHIETGTEARVPVPPTRQNQHLQHRWIAKETLGQLQEEETNKNGVSDPGKWSGRSKRALTVRAPPPGVLAFRSPTSFELEHDERSEEMKPQCGRKASPNTKVLSSGVMCHIGYRGCSQKASQESSRGTGPIQSS